MSTSQPGEAKPPPSGQGFLERMFRRLREIYFFGGLLLVVAGTGMAASARGVSREEFAGLGLCIAGGLSFVASAIVHSRDTKEH